MTRLRQLTDADGVPALDFIIRRVEVVSLKNEELLR